MIQGSQPTEDRTPPNRQSNTMPILQTERGFLIRKPELSRSRPHPHDVRSGRARPNQGDRLIDILAAARIGVALRDRSRTDGERAIIAGAVTEVAMQDVEERRIAGPKNTVTIDMWVRRTTFPGKRVHSLDVFRTQIIERLADQADAFVLAHPRPQ